MITNDKETNDVRESKNKNTVVSAHLRVRQSKTYRAKTDDFMSHGFIDLKISLQFFGMDSMHSSKHSFINDAPGLVRTEQEEDRLDRQGKQKRRGKWLPGTEDWRQGKDKEG